MLCYNNAKMSFSRILSLSLLLSFPLMPILEAAGATQAKPPAKKKSPPKKATRIVNRVAATVNGRPITSSELRARLFPVMQELAVLHPQQGYEFTQALVKAKKDILNELIDRELVLSDFEMQGFMMPESNIDDELNRRILIRHNGRRDDFLKNLRKSGMTYNEYRESVRKEVTVGAMRSSRYERGIPPTPDEIRAEYAKTRSEYRDITQDRVQFDKIFIPVAPDSPDKTPKDQYQLALSVAKHIREGKLSFAAAAKAHSRDAMAEKGGTWPLTRRIDLAADFAGVIFGAKLGSVIGPIYDPSGFSIVRVNRIRQSAAPSLDKPEIKAKVVEAVQRRKSEKRYRQWVKRLRDKAIIRIFV